MITKMTGLLTRVLDLQNDVRAKEVWGDTFTADDLNAQACVRSAFDPDGRMNPFKVLPEGARCGDYAVAAGGTGTAAADAAALPDGSWI